MTTKTKPVKYALEGEGPDGLVISRLWSSVAGTDQNRLVARDFIQEELEDWGCDVSELQDKRTADNEFLFKAYAKTGDHLATVILKMDEF